MSKKLEVRKCAKCGKSFKTNVNGKKYCSVKCYKAAKAELNKASKAKATTKKPVKLADKVKLPKKPTVKSRHVVINPGDVVSFSKKFTAKRVFCYAMRLAALCMKDIAGVK